MKISKKNILLISIIAMFLIAIIVVLIERNKPWVPSIQGSHVMEMKEYEEIDGGFEYEYYDNFRSFKKSSLSEYHFISKKAAKDERYSKEYFKTRNLGILKFNNDKSKLNYYIIDVIISDGNCEVKLLEVKKIGFFTDKPSTYYCFLETVKDLSDLTFTLKIEKEVTYDSHVFSYINMDNEFVYLEGEDDPVIYRINDIDGLNDFIKEEKVLTTNNYIYKSMKLFIESSNKDTSFLLIRIPSSDFERWTATFDQGTINIVGVRTNHYLYEDETKFHSLIVLEIPKEQNVQKIESIKYFEYEDDLFTKEIDYSYNLVLSELTRSLLRYDVNL